MASTLHRRAAIATVRELRRLCGTAFAGRYATSSKAGRIVALQGLAQEIGAVTRAH
jgi:hypothetical protein